MFFDDKLLEEDFVDDLLFYNYIESINEFTIYPMDKRNKSSIKVMVRNNKEDGRSNTKINHGATIKIENGSEHFVPVYIDLKDGNLQFPKDISNDDKTFINSKKKIVKKLIEDNYDELKEYWYADSENPEELKLMETIRNNMQDKYPYRK